MMLEVRYVGSKGSKLLEARAFNQGYDLNAADTPDYIFERFNQAYVAAGSPNGALNAGATARERGLGRAFGFPNASLGGMVDYNLANAAGAVIGFEARGPILGFNIPEAVLLDEHRAVALQLAAAQPARSGCRAACSSTSPTPTRGRRTRARLIREARPVAASPTCRTPGFVVQGNQRDLDANYALSDFDRPHRFSGSWVWDLPGERLLDGFRFSGFVQMQSGLPYSIYSAEPELGNASQYGDLVRGSGGIYRLGFGRPSLCGSLDELRAAGDDPTEAAFNKSVLCSPTTAAGGYPGNQGFGNLGRNVLRGFWQRRVDLSLAKAFRSAAQRNFEVRWDVFNVFNTVNYALPNNVIGAADHRLRQDHRFGRRPARDAARRPGEVLAHEGGAGSSSPTPSVALEGRHACGGLLFLTRFAYANAIRSGGLARLREKSPPAR